MEEDALTEVVVRPLFDEPRPTAAFFESEGFGRYTKLNVFDNYIFIKFGRRDEALRFVKHFNGMRVKGKVLEAFLKADEHHSRGPRDELNGRMRSPYADRDSRSPHPDRERRYPDDRPPRGDSRDPAYIPRPVSRSHTVMVTGYTKDQLCDRTLFNDFWKAGIIRHMECRGLDGYLEFDTEEEALVALEMCAKRGDDLKAQCVADRVLGLPKVLIPLVVLDKKGKVLDELP